MFLINSDVIIKSLKLLSAISIIGFSAITMTGCSALRASPAQTTPFLIHGDKLHSWYEHAPWDAVWSSNPGQVMVRLDQARNIYIAPVNTAYLNKKIDANGKWSTTRDVSSSDVQAMTDLLRNSFINAIKNNPKTNLLVQDSPGPNTLTLELALVELSPTSVGLNSAADIGGVLLPGSKAIEEAAAVGAQAAGGAIAAGTIAIEMKIVDGKTGAVLAEMKDRENDPASIIPNYRDFEEYGWSRNTIADWAKQFAEVFSTSATVQIDNQDEMSIVPW